MKKADLTVLVPTFNRPKELKRLLVFLQVLGNPYEVLVLDGSNPENQARNQANCAQFPNVKFRPYEPGFHLGLRLADGMNQVTTKYSVFCGDDDFLLPDGITKCAEYLEEHTDYSCAVGKTLCLLFRGRILKGGISVIDHLRNPFTLNQGKFIQRLIRLQAFTTAGCPPFYYGVRRTAQSQEIYSKVTAKLKYSSLEFFSDSMTLLEGKARVLPVLTNFRDYSSEAIREPQRDEAGTYFNEDDIKYIRSVFIPRLMKKESLTLEAATYVADLFLELPLKPLETSGHKDFFWGKPRFKAYQLTTAVGSLLSPKAASFLTDVEPKVIKALSRAQLASL